MIRSDTEVFNLPWFLAAVGGAKVGHFGACRSCHVLDPVGHFLRASGAEVPGDIRLDAEHFAEVEEFVGAERIVIHSLLVVVDVGTLVLRANAVHPVIDISEASARPAHYGDLQGLESLEDIFTVTVNIGYGGILAHPQAAEYAAPEVF